MEYNTRHLYFTYTQEPLGECLIRRNTSVKWHVPRYPMRKHCITTLSRSPLQGVCSGIRVVSQPFCVDKLNPAGLISVRAPLPIYLIDQASILQRRAESRDSKFKKIMKTRNILVFIR